MKFLTKITLLFFLLSVALFSKDIATITGLNGTAFIDREGTKIEIRVGTTLQEKDSIITDDKAKVQIIFEDETIVTVGKNSNFSISEYMFEDSQEPVAKFAMLKGAMRTITGKIGKIAPDKFRVQAKTALIGICGTNFSVLVGEDNSVNVYCTHGAIGVTVGGEEYVVRQGFYITISPQGNVEIKEFSSQDLKDMKEKNFGKSVAKKGDATEDAIASNEGQLDTTTEEMDNIVIKDISDVIVDAEQTSNDSPTADSVIAAYGQNNVMYTGTYSTTSNTTPSFGSSGVATLKVSFGLNEALLILNPSGGSVAEKATFDSNYAGLDANEFSSTIAPPASTGPDGSQSGKFYGTNGNTAKGTFDYTPEIMQSSEKATGTYEVTAVNPL
jgi:FecR-like protein